jgi:cytochrome c oxidase subunit II
MLPSKETTLFCHLGWSIFVTFTLAIVVGEIAPRAQTQQPLKIVAIHAKKYDFAPNQITLKVGETVKLVLISDDVRHSLSVRSLGIRSEIAPGRNNEVTVTPTQVGDFTGNCSVYCGSGHRQMEFLIHVVE